MFELLRFLPRNLLSWAVGRLAHLEQPRSLVPAVIRWFVTRYNVDLTEVDGTIESFPSLGAFFVRRLKAGARPVGPEVVSPVDGFVSECGRIEEGLLLQAKGRTYSAEALLGSSAAAARFSAGGTYVTLYLAPPDYHCIHSPVSGEITAMTYIPGSLWPVNAWSVRNIADLFPRNERIVTYLRSAAGEVAVVKVGATNVGAIALSYDSLIANDPPAVFIDRRAVVERRYSNLPVEAGDMLGEFRLGSTVILLFEPGAVELTDGLHRRRVRMGETIARLAKPHGGSVR